LEFSYEVTSWLLLKGAANDENGHVSQAALVEFSNPVLLSGAKLEIHAALKSRSVFTNILLPAVCLSFTAGLTALGPPARRSFLRMLCGHEEAAMSLIADFAGILRGRELRNAREAAVACVAVGGAF
jgi:hypothetical protein